MPNTERDKSPTVTTCIRDMMVPATDVISADEPTRVAIRWLEAQLVRSLIVVEGSRPVGMVGARELRGVDPSEPVGRCMHRHYPLLNHRLPISEVRALLNTVTTDVDRLPVVNDAGQLIGEMLREQLSVQKEPNTVSRGSHIRLAFSAGKGLQPWLEPGQAVLGVEGERLGVVAELCLLGGDPVAFIVRHGLLSHRRTRVPLDLISDLNDESVTLAIDRAAFKLVDEINQMTRPAPLPKPFDHGETATNPGHRREITMTAQGSRAVVQVHMDVYTADAARVGRVKTLRDDNFLVDRQRRRDVYIPYDVVNQVLEAERRVELSVSEDEFHATEWESPPVVGTPEEYRSKREEADPTAQLVGDLMHAPDNLVSAEEPVRATLPQFELETARSLIAVEGGAPVGIFTRKHSQNLTDADLDKPVSDFVTSVPTLTSTMTLEQAGMEVQGVDFDAAQLPVVDADGKLAGVVDRSELSHKARIRVVERGTLVVGEAEAVELAAGMNVLGTGEERLGTLVDLFVEEDQVESLTVAHGPLGRRHKRIAAEHVVGVDDAGAHLDFGNMEFRQLADVEETDNNS